MRRALQVKPSVVRAIPSMSTEGAPSLETAAIIKVALEAGTLSHHKVITWADRHIATATEPPSWLLDVSLSGDAAALIEALRLADPEASVPLATEARLYLHIEAAAIEVKNALPAVEAAFDLAVRHGLATEWRERVFEIDRHLTICLEGGRDGSEVMPSLVRFRDDLLRLSSDSRKAQRIVHECQE